MGPTNVALVNLFRADQQLREAQARLESASRSVRMQERRINEITEKLRLAQTQLREQQARSGQLDLEIRARDARIDKLRTQQQNANNHKEYQAFLTEINTEKLDKGKIEEHLLKLMEDVEKTQADVKDLTASLESEQKRYQETRSQLGGKLSELQAEVDQLVPLRAAAAKALPPKAVDAFDRLAERFEGEAMAAIGKPDRRREEYICNACNMSLVADIYNRLHSRDEMVFCPNCRRLMFIPDELPPELAINKPRERKELRRDKGAPAAVGRQTSAIDVARSINQEQDESAGAAAVEPEPEPEHVESPTSPQQ
jgi:hypothetical protein